jgi:uncharacterized delta-60 repeat protein
MAASLALPCSAADGDADPAFGTDGISYVTPDDVDAREIMPNAAIALPDGKLLFGGARNKIVDGTPWFEPQIRGMLVRLNADGSADASFGNTAIPGLFELPDLVTGTRMQSIESMARADDGSIIAVGTGMVNNPQQGFIVKMGADGTPDAGFGNGGSVLLPAFYPHAIGLDSQGRALVGGEYFDMQSQLYTSTVIRFSTNGEMDATFGDAGNASIVWSDATLSGFISDLKVTPDDGVIIGGSFEIYGSGMGSDFAIARLDSSGALDSTFAGSGWRVFHNPAETSTSNRVNKLVLMPDGAIAFAGYHTSGENMTGLILGGVLADGISDPAFGDAATPGFFIPAILPIAQSVNASAMVAQADGKLIVSASYWAAPDKENFFAIRATASGQLDADFAAAGIFETDVAPDGSYSEISAMTLQPDGQIVVAGRSMRSTESPVVDFAAMRLLNASGPLDLIFADGFE